VGIDIHDFGTTFRPIAAKSSEHPFCTAKCTVSSPRWRAGMRIDLRDSIKNVMSAAKPLWHQPHLPAVFFDPATIGSCSST
jgi:hypothetical protein